MKRLRENFESCWLHYRLRLLVEKSKIFGFGNCGLLRFARNDGYTVLPDGFGITRWVLKGFVLCVFLLGHLSCRSVEKKKELRQVLRYPMICNPMTLDCGRCEDSITTELLIQVYGTLVTYNEHDEIVPHIASSWEMLEGGRIWKFQIRPGVVYSDKTAVFAEHFKWCIERACTMEIGSQIAPMYFSDIVGAEDFMKGKVSQVSGIQALSSNVLQIELKHAKPYWIGYLALPVAGVMKPNPELKRKLVSKIDQVISAGPFQFDSYEPDLAIFLKRNPYYYNHGVKLERIERYVMPEYSTHLTKYLAGGLDMLLIERQNLMSLEKNKMFEGNVHFTDRSGLYFLAMHQKNFKPLNDPMVRRALALAIDRDSIFEKYLFGIGQQAHSLLIPGVPGYRYKAGMWGYDPVAAKECLKQSKYPDPSKWPPITIYYRSGVYDVRVSAEAIALQLKQNLGAHVKLEEGEMRALIQKRNNGEIPMMHSRWVGLCLDPENYLTQNFRTGSMHNYYSYSNPEVDRLLDAAEIVQDRQAGLRLYQQAEDQILRDVTWIPLYQHIDIEWIHPRVKGLKFCKVFGHTLLTDVSMEN